MPDKVIRANARTVLAFDFGLQRVGVAVGETETATVHPLQVVVAHTQPGRLIAIDRLVKEWKPGVLVVGRPLGEDGAAHEMTRRAEKFARQLSGRFRIPVELVDERYSSAEGESRVRAAYGGRKAANLARGKSLDSQAAQIILEQFLSDKTS